MKRREFITLLGGRGSVAIPFCFDRESSWRHHPRESAFL